MSRKITIETITPASSDGNQLKGYYFLPYQGPGWYSFYDPNNNLLGTGIGRNTQFEIRVRGVIFNLYITSISDAGASGDWVYYGTTEVPGSGTFQAQAGGSVEAVEEAAAAKAY
jgi:hypothetical protein